MRAADPLATVLIQAIDHDVWPETATIAMPGGTASAFCDAETTASKPQSSIRNSDAARPLTASTTTVAPLPATASASAAMSFCTPVDVSFCVSRMPS